MRYRDMDAKMKDIYDADSKTLAWIWSTRFSDWLKSTSDEFFWISGKPGSGKSTLMKYLASTKLPTSLLPHDKKDWIRLSFYFDYRAGKDIRNTTEGLLRTFAIQLVRTLPMDRNPLTDMVNCRSMTDIEPEELRRTFCDTLQTITPNVLALIDGLEEYDADYSELVKVLSLLKDRTGMHLCVASRHEGIFRNAFNGSPSLKMQDFNSGTIEHLVQTAIDSKKHDLGSQRSFFLQILKEKILQKSCGVILWARVVIMHLIDGSLSGDTEKQLVRKLQDLPMELKDMYRRILDGFRGRQKHEMALALYLVQQAVPLACTDHIDDFIFAWNATFGSTDIGAPFNPYMDPSEFEGRLIDLSCGLLDVVLEPGEAGEEKKVRLLHETLSSYLAESNWIRENLQDSLKQLYPNAPWLRLYASVIENADPDLAENVTGICPWSLYLSFKPRKNVGRPLQEKPILPDPLLWNASYNMLELARNYERESHSSFSIIRKALHTGLVPLINAGLYIHLFDCFCVDYVDQTPYVTFNLQPNPLKHEMAVPVELAYASLHGLPLYLQDRITTGPLPTPEATQSLVNLAIYGFFHNQTRTQENVVKTVAPHGAGLRSQTICFVMVLLQDLKTMLSPFKIESLLRFLAHRSPGMYSSYQHHLACRHHGSSYSLLYDWVCLDQSAILYGFHIMPGLLGVMKLLGEEINSHCYPGGSILFALLDPRTPVGPGYRLFKFYPAVTAGANGSAVKGPNGQTLLSCALKLRSHLATHIQTASFPDNAHDKDVADVERIIRGLRHYEKYGNWSQLDEEVEKAYPSYGRYVLSIWENYYPTSDTLDQTDSDSS
ncbi:MAG: hypothetical protein Q9222_005975 [Ikaeria aurantiellina]